jgi:hypothetical protein
VGLKLNVTHQLLVYADDVNLLEDISPESFAFLTAIKKDKNYNIQNPNFACSSVCV